MLSPSKVWTPQSSASEPTIPRRHPLMIRINEWTGPVPVVDLVHGHDNTKSVVPRGRTRGGAQRFIELRPEMRMLAESKV